ncbi:MAG: polysulfide reductase [Actinomycetota bacterium]|nr:MAG: polysulfide reductase [Actinomycetota bacterium]
MVPDASFTSYYGRPVVKAAPWSNDIPAYLFLGGLAGGSSLLAAGADVMHNDELRRAARLTALGAIGGSYLALVHDLGRPSRFFNMLRVAKPTSPMSMGTWIITAYGPAAVLAAASEFTGMIPPGRLSRLVSFANRPAGIAAAMIAPVLSSYTAVLLSDTSTPAWNHGFKEMPFVFVGSSATAAGGMAMIASSVHNAAPARRLAIGGALTELLAIEKMKASMGVVSETLDLGTAGKLIRLSQFLTIFGALGSIVFGRKSRAVSLVSGLALVLGSACTKFGVFEAGQSSARDPKYTVAPQKKSLQDGATHARPKTRWDVLRNPYHRQRSSR